MSNDAYIIQKSTLTEIGDAIRAKTGKSDPIPVTSLAEEIKAIVSDGSSGSVGGQQTFVDIPIPEKLQSAKSIYYFSVNEKNILFTASDKNSGLWRYDVENNNFTNLQSEAYGSFYTFWVNENTLLFSNNGTSKAGLWRYDAKSNVFTNIKPNLSTVSKFLMVGEDCVLSGSSIYGMYLYTASTDTLTLISGTNNFTNYSPIIKIDENRVLYHRNNIGGGISLYNHLTKEFTKIYSESGQYTVYFKINNDLFISGWHGVTDYGILKFDDLSNTFTKVYNGGVGWDKIVHSVDNEIFITSSSGAAGLLLYNMQEKTWIRLVDAGKFEKRKSQENVIIFEDNNSNLCLYNIKDKKLYPLVKRPAIFSGYIILNDNEYLAYGAAAGIYLYSTIDETFTQITKTSIYDMDIILGDILAFGSSYLYLYDIENKKVVNLSGIASGTSVTHINIEDNLELLQSSTNTSSGKLTKTVIYNSTLKIAAELGVFIDTIEKINSKLYRMYSKDKSISKYTIELDVSTMAFKRISIAI